MAESSKKHLVVSIMPDQTLCLEWEEVRHNVSRKQAGQEKKIHRRFAARCSTWLFDLGFEKAREQFSPSLTYFIRFARRFVQALSRIPELENLRHAAVVDIPFGTIAEFLSTRPMMAGAEYVTDEMLAGLWQEFNHTFASEIETFEGRVSDYFHARNPDLHPAGRVFFHLVENKNQARPFAFMATYSAGMGANGKPRHLPLKNAIASHDDAALLNLLSTVYKAGEKSRIVAGLIETGELFHPLAWDAEEAFTFLKEIPDYEACGVICRIPDWWKHQSASPRVNISLGDKKPAMTGLDALLDFNAGIMIGDEAFTPEEIETILEESRGLAFIKNRWVAVDPEKLRQALKACERFEDLAGAGLTLGEAMRARLHPEKMMGADSADLEVTVSNGDWLASVLHKMQQPEQVRSIRPGQGFKAGLRPYQSKGLNWLNFLHTHRFGACLADDMGLGKTIQILALLSTFSKKREQAASLLVVPASLIANWEEEINRFLPALKTYAAHPGFVNAKERQHLTGQNQKIQNRKKPPRERQNQNTQNRTGDLALSRSRLDQLDLVITSYTLVKKYQWLQDYTWHCLILDEAQAIKNPGTHQTRAVKSLPATHRIAMTGTPVENRLSDLWSLFDFLNPGLLGSKSEFSTFAKTLKDNPKGYARLRQLISPYILRRLKTDKTVISDLPDKVEMTVFSDLSPKQVILYKQAVENLAHQIANTSGIQRKGLILSSIMRFKQLCNHPDQLTGSGYFTAKYSGKFLRLAEICETIHDKRERVLVFTQFKEMTRPLQSFLESIFHHPGLVLHGSVSVAKRKQLIAQFQDETYCPFMVLSLKAGGVGLNLTRAGHVVHFDRWWNPAVENQATDRAFRIGQTKKVLVHKFVTKGTIEEKIDRMIREKQELADQVVAPSGETLVTEMDDKNLMDLFRLSLPG
ncbi:MAG: DEAD/DEAH box helicase [Desulfotignum sp.]|nr:DEAD/DEAH box helicase [Desulfotignum sp.]